MRSHVTALSVIVFIALLVLSGCGSQGEQPAQPTEAKQQAARFVDGKTCITCHDKQYTEWTGSHHDLAMQGATEKTVLGDFDDTTFSGFGLTTKFFKRDGKFIINTDGPDGNLHDYEVSYVFGVDPLQQYLVVFPDGRYQALDIAWDTRSEVEGGQRWFHLHPDEKVTSEHIFHWTGQYLNWNFMCAECHSTKLKRNYDLATDTYKTTWSEVDVSCQACHGPGSNHLEWADVSDTKDDSMGLEVDLSSGNQVEACARCHARRSIVDGDYSFGKDFMEHYVPQLLIEPYYYADGQIRDEVYVYGSFIQAKKHRQGVRCTDCHNPHTAGLKIEGNSLCIRCHKSAPPEKFKTLKPKNYDTAEHHFHKDDSPGSKCVDCHMPDTRYMVVDPRRDHGFRIPRPDLTNKIGTPNACNGCHTDKKAEWAAAKIDGWYPDSKVERENKMHFAETFAAAQAGKAEAGAGLIELAGDSTQSAIVRATALYLLSQYGGKEPLDAMTASLEDANPLVRYEAVRGISAILLSVDTNESRSLKLLLLGPLLVDKIRAVRTEAARALTDVPHETFNQEQLSAFDKALDEYKDRQFAIEDRPEAHLNLGMVHQNLADAEKAEASYKTAIRQDRFFVPARINLANLYNTLGRNDEAEGLIREVINLEPEYGEAHYSLGLLLAEMKRLDEAVVSLQMATELMPEHARVRFNYALALQGVGRLEEAEAVLLKAHNVDKNDPNIVHALTVLYAQQGRFEKALPYGERLVELLPDAPGAKQLLKQIKGEASGANGVR
jgi:predicted CXXCH cytochrome family protein